MSNSFTKAAFALLMSREDAALLREAEKAVDLLDTNGEDADLAAAYETLDERFHSSQHHDVFGGNHICGQQGPLATVDEAQGLQQQQRVALDDLGHICGTNAISPPR